jgi:hypothetical protein
VKLAFLIASHKNPEQVRMLVDKLLRDACDPFVVISHDKTCSRLKESWFQDVRNVYLLPGSEAAWGTFSLVETALRGMRWLHDRFRFDWLCYLSGQDYPIKPLPDIETFLRQTRHDGFLRSVPIDDDSLCGENECRKENGQGACVTCSKRYLYRYYPVPEMAYAVLPSVLIRRVFQKIRTSSGLLLAKNNPQSTRITHVGVKPKRTVFNSGFRCYKGSQWFTINARCVRHVLGFTADNPWYVNYYRRTLIPDESFFHTILRNNPGLDIENDNLRYIAWEGHKPSSPKVLGKEDLMAIMNSEKHFARKFDMARDPELIGLVDATTSARPRQDKLCASS